jgi:hypothetical protein
MAPPTTLRHFCNLPVDIQRHIFDIPTAEAFASLTPTIPMRVYFLSQDARDWRIDAPVGECYTEIDRTEGPTEAHIPLVLLYSQTQAAMERVEVPDVVVDYTTPGIMKYRGQSLKNCPPLPLRGGATQELLLRVDEKLHSDGCKYSAKELFTALSRVFGTGLRRIHLKPEGMGWNTRVRRTSQISSPTYMVWNKMIRSSQGTKTAYTVKKSDLLWRHGWMSPFGLPETWNGEYRQVTQTELGEFDGEECRVFTHTIRVLNNRCKVNVDKRWACAEIVRHYPDGRTLVNSGFKKAEPVQKLNCTSLDVWSRCRLQQLATLAKEYFPSLEYVSVLDVFEAEDDSTSSALNSINSEDDFPFPVWLS